MADWALPTLTTAYATVLTNFKDRDVDAYTLAETPTSPPVGAKRWNVANSKLQSWDGAAWNDLVLSLAGGGTGSATAAGARTNLGLGDMALQNANAVAITGGNITGLTNLTTAGGVDFGGGIQAGSGNVNIVDGTGKIPELSATYIASLTVHGQWTFDGNAPAISFANGTSNWIQWNTSGVAAPAFTTRSAGTKLVLYPGVTAIAVDFAIGIESNTTWFSVPDAGGHFKFYAGTTAHFTFDIEGSAFPTINISPANTFGSRLQICGNASGSAPGVIQSGEPGVSFNHFIIGNNYHATSGAASARINTSIGGSYIRFGDQFIDFMSITNTGIISQGLRVDPFPKTPLLAITNTGLSFTYQTFVGASIDITTDNTGLLGANLTLRRNSLSFGAPGFLQLQDKAGNFYAIWVDSAGKLRIGSSPPRTDNVVPDNSGTIVGTQT